MRLLFSGGDLRSYLHGHNLALHDEVQRTPSEHVLQADLQAWSTALAEAYAVQVPVVRPDDWWADEPLQCQVDVSHEWASRAIRDPSQPALVPGTQHRIYVPFDGDAEVFHLRASTYTYNPPYAEVESDTLIFDLSSPNDRPTDPAAIVRSELTKIDEFLRWSQGDAEGHNGGLDGYARAQIERRIDSIRASRAALATGGIPVRPGGGKQRISDMLVRRPAPRRQVGPVAPHVPLEPVLRDEDYEHILRVMRLQGDSMQRAPQPYVGMNEEALRQVLLAALNTHYGGRVSAEAFNGAGKTDIMVRDGERAVFIAECKRWTGAKGLSDGLDQLLSYSTWHDSKLALVVFVDRVDLGDVIAKATTLTSHPAVARLGRHTTGDLRGYLVLGEAHERRAELAVVFIHLPTA